MHADHHYYRNEKKKRMSELDILKVKSKKAEGGKMSGPDGFVNGSEQ